MGRYRKKPVVIEAVLWTGREENLEEVLALVDFDKLPSDGVHVQPGIGFVPPFGTLDIPTLEGTMTAMPGDWIIKGVAARSTRVSPTSSRRPTRRWNRGGPRPCRALPREKGATPDPQALPVLSLGGEHVRRLHVDVAELHA
jgi:hypothetical protein